MATGACSESPSDLRRLRAARLNFEAPSFSLGIDTGSFSSFPSFEEFPENNVSHRGEQEEKSDKVVRIVVQSESEDDLETIGSQQQRRLKRLKRGPSSAAKARDFPVFARRRSKDVSECATQLYKEPLPFVNNSTNRVADAGHVAGIQSPGFGQERFQDVSADRFSPSSSACRNNQKRSEPESSLGSGEISHCSRDFNSGGVPKFESKRKGGDFSLNRDQIPSVQNVRSNLSEDLLASSNGDVEADDIEEFSDDELFRSGSRTQNDRKSLRPQMSGPSPILLSSSPETSQKEKTVLHIPGLDIPQNVPFKMSQPSEEDTIVIDDFGPESGWRRTRQNLSVPAQTPQQRRKPTSVSQRPNSLPNLYKKSQQHSFVDTDFFQTETPARPDIVGPSEDFRNNEVNETEEDRIQAFFRRRFPHYKPVDALLVDGGLDGEPVYIDYRRQFAESTGRTQIQSGNASMRSGARWPKVRSISDALHASPSSPPPQRRSGANKRVKNKSQSRRPNSRQASSSAGPRKRAAGGSRGGRWSTVNGSRVFIVGGKNFANKKSGGSSTKKSKKRPSTKAK